MPVPLLWGLFSFQVSRCLSGLKVFSLSMRVWTFHAPFVYCFLTAVRYTASHSIMASLGGTSIVWDIFSSPLPPLRVGTAYPKKGSPANWKVAKLLCCPRSESNDQSLGFLCVQLGLWLRVFSSTYQFAPSPLPQERCEMRWDMQRTRVAEFLKWRSCCIGQSHCHILRRWGPVVWRFIMTGDFLGCSQWLWHLECLATGCAFHRALQNHLPGFWILLMISSAQYAGTCFAC